jgi:alkylation response protein AidB-like acyl-CoA dehydrogenase
MDFTPEQVVLRETVRRLAREVVAPRASALDEEDRFPHDLARRFGELGLVQLLCPEKYGGPGGNFTSICIAREEMAKVSAAAALIVGNNTIGGVLPLVLQGSEALREQYLPQLASGTKLTAVAITEPEAGSDVAAMRTRAVRDGDHYVINGRKCFITFGDVADYVTLLARTGSDDYGFAGITAFFVETAWPGFAVTRHERKMGIRGSTNVELTFDNLRVPVSHRLGAEGEGFKLAMQILDRNRVTVGAAAVGLAQGALDVAADYAMGRVQFRRPIAKLQAIQFMLADMAIKIEAARSLVYRAARLVDWGDPAMGHYSAMAKCFASDVAMEVTTDAVQVLGGYGYMKDYPVERMMRDAKIMQIFEGTNQIQRVVVARHLLEQRGAGREKEVRS